MTQGLLISRLNKLLPNIPQLRTACKKAFFENQLCKYQSNMKKTWELINMATRKSKKNKDEISCINIDGRTVTDSASIADKFNIFFVNIAAEI
jgi:hypothetical protein